METEQTQDAPRPSSCRLVFERMIRALNRHDLDAMVECFAANFRSEQPLYPERTFTGQAGVQKNWSFFFATIPDIQGEIQRLAVEGDTVWAELFYHGTQVDGKKHVTRGVSISGIQGGHIMWAKVYLGTAAEP